MMHDALEVNPLITSINAEELKNIALIQAFFTKELKTTKDQKILAELMRLYVDSVPPQQAYPLLKDAYTRLNIDQNNPIKTYGEYYRQLFEVVFETKEAQVAFLNGLLKEGGSLKGDKREAFLFALCRSLEFQPNDQMDDLYRPGLEKMLLKEQATLLGEGRANFSHTDFKSCDWLMAYGMVVSNNTFKVDTMAKYLCSIENPILQARLVLNLSSHKVPPLILALSKQRPILSQGKSPSCLDQIRKKLLEKEGKQNLSDKERHWVESAYKRLTPLTE